MEDIVDVRRKNWTMYPALLVDIYNWRLALISPKNIKKKKEKCDESINN